MKDIIKQIKIANENKLYYLALWTTLTLPDICAALESEDGKTKKDKYIKWVNKYLTPKYNGNLDGETCYYFRCSILHQGYTNHEKNRYSKIIFLEPNNSYKFHNNIINDVLNIDIEIFCNDVCESVEEWLEKNKNNEIVKKNLEKMIKRHPHGLTGYIEGILVIVLKA
jgi:hypothetical protein